MATTATAPPTHRSLASPYCGVMDLGTPLHVGGTHYVAAVTVGCDPDDETVWDCPICGGRGAADEFHLEATVLDTDTGRREPYRYCDDACLADWLRTLPST